MACFHPLSAERLDDGSIVFNVTGKGHALKLPCGRCIGCRLERSKMWAMRCVHEASLHEDNCFITLTYNAENLPPDCGLIKKDYKDFMKRLRLFLEEHTWNGKEYVKNRKISVWSDRAKRYIKRVLKCYNKVRYYHCGEYGDRNNRPHYHAILFGWNFHDWTYLFDSPSGQPIFTSPTLEKIWGFGFVTVGAVTFESAAYVARYCVKKINGDLRDVINEETGLKHYERFNSYTGEISEVLPEYSTMSRRPGIGHNWISTYTRDCYPKDFTTIKGVRMKPPRYYDKYLESIDPMLYDDIKQSRLMSIQDMTDELSELRLASREKVKEAQHSQLKRSL